MRRLLFISDTHIGSRYAIAPSNFVTAEGAALVPNNVQQQLYYYWNVVAKKAEAFGVDTVILLGDLIEGLNRREDGRHLMTPNMNEQVEMAVMLLEPICRDKKVYVIEGSRYHVAPRGLTADQVICARLGGTFLGRLTVAKFPPSPLTFLLTHGIGGAVIYEATRLDRENLFLNAAATLVKVPKIDVVVMGHFHHYLYIHQNGQHMFQLPCWKVWEPSEIFMRHYGKRQPDIGALFLFVSETGRIQHELCQFELPHIADEIREL